ncbi:MAG TPA: putative metal-binding motif-containing protein, partial [Candidatus Polarisedimenticolaceae bacterium]|nr:putative metal-binding motif-containing protein [Candidatus Polarisedimenticolaceae bacterium]
GRMIWTSRLTNDGRNLSAAIDTALFGGNAGNFSVLAREGDLALGTASAHYGDFSPLDQQTFAVNRNGNVMFIISLTGGDVVGTTNDTAIYGGTIATGPVLAARKGDTMLPGITAAAFSGGAQMDNNGRIIYYVKLAGAGVTTTNDDSIWLYTPASGNQMLVREGDAAPGTTGAVLSTPQISPNAFTRNGKFSFVSSLSGGDVVAGVNDNAIFVGQTGGAVSLFARSGQPATGTDGVFATFHPSFTFPNDSGRVNFQATLKGGTTTSANDSGIWSGTVGALTLVAREGSAAPGTNGASFDSLIGFGMVSSDFGIVFTGFLKGGDVVRTTNDRGSWAFTPTKGTFLVGRNGDPIEPIPGMFRTTASIGGIMGNNNTDGAPLALTHTGLLVANVGYDVGTSIATVDLNCAPATDYYLDSDGDGHGDPTTEINLCTGEVPPPGYITTAGDCLDSNPAALGASAETCNGLDDDCDTLIDEGIPIPSAPLALNVGKGSGNNVLLSWGAVAGATGYDIVAGDLTELRGSHGYQFLSQASCLQNDLSATTLTVNTPVTVGNAKWWVMRPLNCDGDGTFGSGSPKERPGRDQEIGASFYSCP